MPLSQVPVLAYPELVKSDTIALLVGLLSHENIDIVIDVVELIHELTDEDVGGEEDADEDAEEEGTGRDAGVKLLVEALVSNGNSERLLC
jgi:beta-catenin-like protein 1